MNVIYVYNDSKLVTDDEALRACAAIQRQVTQHFEPAWKCTAMIHFARADETLPAGRWPFRLVDKIDVQGAFGYHTNEGVPSALIDVALCLQERVSWTSCLSHEVLEAVADPECVRCFDTGDGKVISLEVSDAVEGSRRKDGGAYQIDGVELENFCLPSWFIAGSEGPWDFLGVLPGPLTRTDGGYDTTAPIGRWAQRSGGKTRSSKLITNRHTARRAVRIDRIKGLEL